MSVRVMVRARVDEHNAAAFEAAFAQVRQNVAGTPGHLEDQLLRCNERNDEYILLSHWQSMSQFLEWEDAPIHRQMTTPMRPYWSSAVERTIYEVAV